MSTPLKVRDGDGNIQEFTTAEENYLAYQIGLHLLDDSANAFGKLTLNDSDDTAVGTFTNTFFNEPVGTHPSTSITSGSTSSFLSQSLGSAAETDSDILLPLKWIDSSLDGPAGFRQFSDTDLNTAVDRYLTTIFTNDYPGTFYLADAAPSGDYAVHLSNVFTDTRTDGTSVPYNVYRRTSITAPSTVRPMFVEDSAGGSGIAIREMNDRQIRFSFGQRARTRIGTSKIGTYQLRSSTAGAPTDPGTWVAKGTATDTKQTTSQVEYTSDFTIAYTGNYQTDYQKDYTSNYLIDYQTDYTRDYTSQYQKDYITDYNQNYSNVYSTNYGRYYDLDTTTSYTRGFNLQERYTNVADLYISNTSQYTRVYGFALPTGALGYEDDAGYVRVFNSYIGGPIIQTPVYYTRFQPGNPLRNVYTPGPYLGSQNYNENPVYVAVYASTSASYEGPSVYSGGYDQQYLNGPYYLRTYDTAYQQTEIGYTGATNTYVGTYIRDLDYTNEFVAAIILYQRGSYTRANVYTQNTYNSYVGNNVGYAGQSSFYTTDFYNDYQLSYQADESALYTGPGAYLSNFQAQYVGAADYNSLRSEYYTGSAAAEGIFQNPNAFYLGPSYIGGKTYVRSYSAYVPGTFYVSIGFYDGPNADGQESGYVGAQGTEEYARAQPSAFYSGNYSREYNSYLKSYITSYGQTGAVNYYVGVTQYQPITDNSYSGSVYTPGPYIANYIQPTGYEGGGYTSNIYGNPGLGLDYITNEVNAYTKNYVPMSSEETGTIIYERNAVFPSTPGIGYVRIFGPLNYTAANIPGYAGQYFATTYTGEIGTSFLSYVNVTSVQYVKDNSENIYNGPASGSIGYNPTYGTGTQIRYYSTYDAQAYIASYGQGGYAATNYNQSYYDDLYIGANTAYVGGGYQAGAYTAGPRQYTNQVFEGDAGNFNSRVTYYDGPTSPYIRDTAPPNTAIGSYNIANYEQETLAGYLGAHASEAFKYFAGNIEAVYFVDPSSGPDDVLYARTMFYQTTTDTTINFGSVNNLVYQSGQYDGYQRNYTTYYEGPQYETRYYLGTLGLGNYQAVYVAQNNYTREQQGYSGPSLAYTQTFSPSGTDYTAPGFDKVYTGSHANQYELVYAGIYTGIRYYQRIYSNIYENTAVPFNANTNYSTTFTASLIYEKNYDGASGTYSRNYQRNFQRISGVYYIRYYTRNIFGLGPRPFTGRYLRNYAGPTYARTYVRGYVSPAIPYTKAYSEPVNYTGAYQGTITYSGTRNYQTGPTVGAYESAPAFGGDYANNYTGGPYNIEYQPIYTTTFSDTYVAATVNPYLNWYITSYVNNYLLTFTTLYTKYYTNNFADQYSTLYEKAYTIVFTELYNKDYTTDYIALYVGNFEGETIDATDEVIETYTLYVRIA